MKNVLKGIDWLPIAKFFGWLFIIFFATMSLIALGNSSVGYKWWVFVPNAVLYVLGILWITKRWYYTSKKEDK